MALQGAALKLRHQCRERLAAVAQRILARHWQLGCADLMAGGYEQWVVAKPTVARRAGRNPALPAATCDQRRGIRSVAHQDQYATIAPAATFGGHTRQLSQQPCIIVIIGG